MANGFLNAQTYSNSMLLLLKNKLVMANLVTGQFKDEVTDENGLTTSIKAPPRFTSQSGAALATQRALIGSRTVTVDQYSNVHLSIGDLESVQSFNDLMKNSSMQSAASALAHTIDAYLGSKILEFSTMASTTGIGTPVSTPQLFNTVHTRLMAQGVPNEQLSAVLAFVDGEKIRGSLIGGFIQGVNENALERVKIPMMSEIDAYATQQLPSYTNGTHVMSAGPTIAAAAQNVNYTAVKTTMVQTLNLAGLGNTLTFAAGETFTIAGVNEWDWRQQKPTGSLQRFVVIASGTTSGTGTATVTISPPIIVPGTSDGTDTIANTSFATVDSIPANGAAVTFDGAVSTLYTPRAAFHRSSIALVSAKLQRPFTGESSYSTDLSGTGLSIRYWRGSDINTGNHIHRFDCIYGATNIDRRLGARLYG